MLAGISVDYYLRLEQGRDQHPSSQVLDALARALRLDVKATEHLHRLAGLRAARSPRPVAETAADGLDQLIDQISLPAIVTNRYQDVLAANAIARALSPGFAPGENFLRWRLLAPAARDFFVDWDEATEVAVSGLRESAAGDLGDPRLRGLIDDLSAASDRFCELWARADVGYATSASFIQTCNPETSVVASSVRRRDPLSRRDPDVVLSALAGAQLYSSVDSGVLAARSDTTDTHRLAEPTPRLPSAQPSVVRSPHQADGARLPGLDAPIIARSCHGSRDATRCRAGFRPSPVGAR